MLLNVIVFAISILLGFAHARPAGNTDNELASITTKCQMVMPTGYGSCMGRHCGPMMHYPDEISSTCETVTVAKRNAVSVPVETAIETVTQVGEMVTVTEIAQVVESTNEASLTQTQSEDQTSVTETPSLPSPSAVHTHPYYNPATMDTFHSIVYKAASKINCIFEDCD